MEKRRTYSGRAGPLCFYTVAATTITAAAVAQTLLVAPGRDSVQMAQPSAWLRTYCYNTRSSKTAFSNNDIVKGDVLTSTTPATINYCYYSCYYYSCASRCSCERATESLLFADACEQASERASRSRPLMGPACCPSKVPRRAARQKCHVVVHGARGRCSMLRLLQYSPQSASSFLGFGCVSSSSSFSSNENGSGTGASG